MRLFIEKRECVCGQRTYPLAVISGLLVQRGKLIEVIEPDEFRREHPLVPAFSFQEVCGSVGDPRMLWGDTEEEIEDVMDGIISACKAVPEACR